jgi:preprotein translocase SecE subunit
MPIAVKGNAMTVAVKNVPELNTRSLFDRLAVSSLAGVIYVLGSVGLVVKGLPALWWVWLHLSRDSFPAWALLIVAMFAAVCGLVYVGGKLLGPSPPRGVRAGIFVGLIGIVLIGLITRWIGGALDSLSFEHHWFSQQVGIWITIAIGVVLLGLLIRYFFHPRFEAFLQAFEDQGWFSANSYKASQGLRVRRGTMLGILLIVGSGVWAYERSLQSGAENWEVGIPFTATESVRTRGDVDSAPGLNMDWGSQERISDAGDWSQFKKDEVVSVADVQDAQSKLSEDNAVKIREGDAGLFSADDFIDHPNFVVKKTAFDKVQASRKEIQSAEPIAGFKPKPPQAAAVLDRYYVQQKNQQLGQNYVKITRASQGDQFKVDEIVPKDSFDAAVKERQDAIAMLESEAQKLRDEGQALDARRKEESATALRLKMPEAKEPTPMEGVMQSQMVTLVPSVRFVMPLILGAAALWLAWRVVNLPSFADFLIATEAELNKVSWTPRRRLVQDTIVVLVTTVLITFFLLFADLVWSQLLTRVGVLRSAKQDTTGEVQPGGEDLPW